MLKMINSSSVVSSFPEKTKFITLRTYGILRLILYFFVIAAFLSTAAYAQKGASGKPKDESDPAIVKLAGTSRFKNPKEIRIAKMMLAVKNGKLNPEGFFKGLADAGGNMKDVIKVKKDLESEGLKAEFLGEDYPKGGTPVEDRVLNWRRAQTELSIKESIKGKSSGSSVFVAYVGSWVGQDSKAMKFESDIDFSFVSRDTDIISQLKSAFENELTKRTGLSSKAIDSVCTKHGKADLDVYIGKHGAEYALSQMRTVDEIIFSESRLGRLSEDSAQGTVRSALGEAVSRVVRESELHAAELRAPAYQYNAEPGLSMENLRHFYSDIVREGIYSPMDTVVKAAKYVNRSDEALMKYLGIGPSDPGMSALSGELDRLKKSSNVKQMDQKVRGYFQQKYGSMPFVRFEVTTSGTGGAYLMTKPNANIMDRFSNDCISAMWKNVEVGYSRRIEDIRKQLDQLKQLEGSDSSKEQAGQLEETLSKEIDDLERMTDIEMDVLKNAGLTNNSVSELHETFKAMADEFRQGRAKATPDMLKDKEYLKAQFEAKTKLGRMLGIAYLMNKIEKGLDLGDKGMSSINFYLDILDDRLLGELRGDNPDLNRFMTEYKEAKHIRDSNKRSSVLANLKGTVVSGIQQVNLKCNESIQSTATGRGAVKGLVAIGLVEEGAAYRDAYLNGGWGELATEFFRRRVPFGSSVEQAMMGNYLTAGWEVVTTLVPPVGLAQAAVGISKYALYDMPLSFYWTEQLNVFVDSLYATATFKLIGVESYENAKVGIWRLVSAKYSGGVLNVEQFTKYKQEQIEEMRQQLQKPLSQRKTDFKGVGITDDKDIDAMLKKNIAATDAALNLIDQMMKNEYVGQRLMQHYGDIYNTRWEEAKLNFVLNMIHQLEKRKAIDDALLRGMLPDMFAELIKIAKELKIEAELEKEMDKELNTNNLKAIFNWLWNMKRDLFSEGQIESDYTKAGEIVKRYLDAYKAVYEARQEAEGIFAAGRPVEHGKRILTGADFLVAKPEDDKKTAAQYYQFVTSTRDAVEKELLEIKTGCIPGAKLDSEYDRKTFSNLVRDRVWQRLWSDLFKSKSDNFKEIDSRQEYPKRAKEHNDKSIAAIKEFKEYYSKNCLVISIESDPAEPYMLGQAATLRAVVKLPVKAEKPPVFRYIWSDMKDSLRLGEQTDTFRVNTSAAGTFEIKLQVMKAEGNKWEKFGEAAYKFKVLEKLKINIKAPEKASVGQSVDFSVVTEPDFPGASALHYAWRMKGSTQVIENRKSFSKRVDYPGTYEFSVVVYQTDMVKKQSIKLGEAKHTMVVGQGTTVDITGPAQISIGENVPFTAKVSKPETDTGGFAKAAGGIISSIGKELFGKDIMGSGTQAAAQPYVFEWHVDGARAGGPGGSLTHAFAAQGNHTVRVIAYEDIEGKKQKLGEKTVTVNVSEKPSLKGNASISGPSRIKKGETASFNGYYSGCNAPESTLYFNWIVDGQHRGNAKSISVPGQSVGQRTIELELWSRTKSKPIRLSKASRILVIEEQKTEQKKSAESIEAKGQAICDCMDKHLIRIYDKPGEDFVFVSRTRYNPRTKTCNGTSWRKKGVGFHNSADQGYPLSDIERAYWDRNTGRCKE